MTCHIQENINHINIIAVMKREYIIPSVNELAFVSAAVMENVSAGGLLGGTSPEELNDPGDIH